MAEPRIGILGAPGAVGRAVVRRLHDWGLGPLRLGGRNPAALATLLRDALDGDGETCVVDVADAAALGRFVRGLQVVVNAVGPSWELLDQVARPALAAGAHYVDVGGDERLYQRLTALRPQANGRAAVVAAGMIPGLSGLLPRLVAAELDRVTTLHAYLGVLDRFSPGGASDYVAGIDGSGSLAAFIGGRRVAHALVRLDDVELPLFPRRVTAHPYLDHEGERVARGLALDDARFYSVFDGPHRLRALSALAGRARGDAARKVAGERIQSAAELDLAGRSPYQLMLFEGRGLVGGREVTRSLVLRSVHAVELTATMAAQAAALLLDGAPAGSHFASELLDPVGVATRLRQLPDVSLQLFAGPLAEEAIFEEGSL
jgi:hypothetical protein